MSSFIFQHFSLVSSPPPPPFLVSSSPFHSSHISLSFPNKKSRFPLNLKARAHDSDSSAAPNGEGKPPNGTLPKSRREILLDYVKNVQPEFMELFVKRAPQQVVDAMRQTLTNIIGMLPPQFFAVTATTYRLELQQSLEQVALPDVQDTKT